MEGIRHKEAKEEGLVSSGGLGHQTVARLPFACLLFSLMPQVPKEIGLVVVHSHRDHRGLSISLTVSFGGDIQLDIGEQKEENPNALEKFCHC